MRPDIWERGPKLSIGPVPVETLTGIISLPSILICYGMSWWGMVKLGVLGLYWTLITVLSMTVAGASPSRKCVHGDTAC
ncbi:hypothetical protein B6U66_03060 [Candidatus Bathyarchaeota archaeon ex4484_135]|nr:MAG: hypothetical protein B6U66_03060 [Candidatus Bathyarchaeota archaeon ex4484_135]